MNRVLQTRVLRSFLVHRTVTASVSTPCASSTRPAAWRSDRLVATSASSSADATTDTGAQRVVVIGGGFGGLYAAIRLSSLFWPKGKTPQITVVDKGDRFTFKPLLYELLNGSAGEDEVAPRFEQLLAPYPIRFIQAQVVGVDESEEGSSTGHAGTTGGVVQLEGGASVEYDWLVVGLGSTADARGVPGVKELALSFNVYDDAVVVKAALEQIEAAGDPSQAVMIVGAGYAGVELATVVAERLGGAARVQLVTPADNILDGCPPGQRDAALRVLAQLGVEVLPRTRVLEVSRAPDQSSPVSTAVSVSLSNSVDAGPRDVPAAAVLWTAGATPATQVPAQRKGLPFPVSRRGAVVIEPTLRVAGHPQVFALGDVSVNEPGGTGAPALPATAQVAFQQADYVAWNLWASLNGRTLLTFKYQHLGSMMSLGQLNAAVALPMEVPAPIVSALQASPLGPLLGALGVRLGSDAPGGGSGDGGGVTVDGPLAQVMRRAAYLYRQPTNEQRASVASGWLQQAFSMASSGRLPGAK